MRTTDRRFIRTEKTITASCISLLNELKLSYITIEDVCFKADINKSTFYLHYQSLDMLFSAIEDAFAADLSKFVHSLGNDKSKKEFFDAIFEFVKTNKKTAAAAFACDRYRFNIKLRNIFLPFLNKTKPNKRNKIDDENYFSEISLTDCVISIFRLYLLDGCHFSSDVLSNKILSILEAEPFVNTIQSRI